MGWGGITNGKLLTLAESEFDVFITLDRNLEFQQNLRKVTFGIIVVKVVDNKIESYRPLFAQLLRLAGVIQPGQVMRLPNADK